jgi:predicted outer membrane protein
MKINELLKINTPPMKKINLILLVLLGSTVILSSCQKDAPTTYLIGNQTFVTTASSNYSFETQAGKLAMSLGSSDSVKAMGSTMVSYNGKFQTQLAALASQKGYTIPTTLTPQDQSNLTALTTLNGVAFDKQYAAIMVSAHTQTLNLFNTAASFNGVQDASLRTYASGQLPALATELTMSQNLQVFVSSEPGY